MHQHLPVVRLLTSQELIDSAHRVIDNNSSQLQQLASKAGFSLPDDQGVHQAYSTAVQEWEEQLLNRRMGGCLQAAVLADMQPPAPLLQHICCCQNTYIMQCCYWFYSNSEYMVSVQAIETCVLLPCLCKGRLCVQLICMVATVTLGLPLLSMLAGAVNDTAEYSAQQLNMALARARIC
jgi:hypothetical protein